MLYFVSKFLNMHQLICFSILVAFFLSGCEEKTVNKIEKAKNQESSLEVHGIIAKKMARSENIKTTGTVLPGEKVEVKSEISGRITQLFFKEGSMVKKGQVLAKLDDSQLQAEKKKLLLQVDMETIKEKRQKQLLAAKALSQEEYDLTEANLNILKSNIDIINTQIAKTTITAPFSGIVSFRDISQGAMITPNDIITTLHSIQPVKIEFSVSEKLSKDMKAGKNISFYLASDNKERKATIYAIDPQINPQTRSLVLRARYENPGNELLPGAFADINIEEGVKADYIAIPSMAYVPDISGALVYLKKNGKVTPSKVLAAGRSESQVFIQSGIEPGDTVITSGLLQIKPGMPVEVNIPEN